MEILVEEVMNNIMALSKKGVMSYENVDLASGGHLSAMHVGLTNEFLLRRQRQDSKAVASSFNDQNDVAKCLARVFSDPYSAKRIAEWVVNGSKSRLVESFWFDETGVIGRVLYPNGAIFETESFEIVFGKKDIDYYNKTTGMPFDVITMYPVQE